ncbi:MAG: dihydroorotate dehydrogenase (quinone) [Bdellovibrionales bacterium RIFCSPHIGHO2_01_FULL_40_29]|nr:MAG: dihydroorotate dehydrogenase (quinone) [Bdellovibrionales bacterium RIFCSPHIGHO2_01_FULL_40_29]OFZ35519.1 MAG: dihydroorotate dehydrogenase (quinone) [Bdellovibrionales bacterium RIFCSPHIGHO2_02_FULL_40_15]
MKPWLVLPAQIAHDLSPIGLKLYSLLNEIPTPAWKSFVWESIVFKNRLGIAGGVDKNGELLDVWNSIGCGFAEIGTVTPEPQEPNPGKILDRSLKDFALWNQMGFPSAGADDVFFNIRNFKMTSSLPVFVNIGKNRQTSNENAHQDYTRLLQRFYSVADAFVVNISSPNTKGLRELAQAKNLEAFLNPLQIAQRNLYEQHGFKKPVVLKLSPDLESDDFKNIIDTSLKNKIDGFVLTNTTLSRTTEKSFPPTGGVSGKPLQDLSKKALQIVCSHLGSEKHKKLIISVGGVMTAEDVFERIDLGADLVEVYTTLIFQGPGFFKGVAQKIHGKNGK